MNEELSEIVEFIKELEEEGNMPKNVKAKFQGIVKELKETTEENLSLTINKLLSDLDEISSDANLDQFTRQQIWSISSMLEGI
ncbi:MAG: UPF0147 family protein [Nanoarchaeota archaeon]|nr:UPF0147 family protein [Nanoarchaeota archaeon]